MSKNVPNDLGTFLASAGLGLTLGTNIFIGPVRDSMGNIPNDSVFLIGGAGSRPERTMGEVSEIKRAIVHVRVRSRTFNTGYTLARGIKDAVQGSSITDYIDSYGTDSEPLVLGQDNEGRYMFNLGIAMVYEDAAA